jgi:hypothetical protein
MFIKQIKNAKEASIEAFGFADKVSPICLGTNGCRLGGTLRSQKTHIIEKQHSVFFALIFAAFAVSLFNPWFTLPG